jgi:hypothetical protein
MQNINYLNVYNNVENGFNYPGDESLLFRHVLFQASDGTALLLPLDTQNLTDHKIGRIFINSSEIFKEELLGKIENAAIKDKLIGILNNVNNKILFHFRNTKTGGSRKLKKSSKSKKFKKSKSRKH